MYIHITFCNLRENHLLQIKLSQKRRGYSTCIHLNEVKGGRLWATPSLPWAYLTPKLEILITTMEWTHSLPLRTRHVERETNRMINNSSTAWLPNKKSTHRKQLSHAAGLWRLWLHTSGEQLLPRLSLQVSRSARVCQDRGRAFGTYVITVSKSWSRIRGNSENHLHPFSQNLSSLPLWETKGGGVVGGNFPEDLSSPFARQVQSHLMFCKNQDAHRLQDSWSPNTWRREQT